MKSLIGAYARVLMPHGSPTSQVEPRDRTASPANPLSLLVSSVIYRVICWLERAMSCEPMGRLDGRGQDAAEKSGTFDA